MTKHISLLLLLLFTPITASHADLNPLLQSQLNAKNDTVVEIYSINQIGLYQGGRITLIGIKNPFEAKKTSNIVRDEHGFVVEDEPAFESLEDSAMTFMNELLLNKKISIEYDTQKYNPHSQKVAYVFLKDGTFVNAEILRQGFAELAIRPPNLKYVDDLRAAYLEAKQERRGLQGQ